MVRVFWYIRLLKYHEKFQQCYLENAQNHVTSPNIEQFYVTTI